MVEAFGRGLEVRIEEVALRSSELERSAIVVAAGADTPALLPGLPIEREDRWLFYSDPIAERLLEPLVVSPERRFAAKQLGNGRVLASDLGARGDEAGREQWRANIRAGIEELLPMLTYVSLPLLVHGEYDVTPDHQPMLGQVEEGVYVAAGFSGHGFMIAPAVARILADAILDGDARRGARRSRRGAFRRRPARARAAAGLVGRRSRRARPRPARRRGSGRRRSRSYSRARLPSNASRWAAITSSQSQPGASSSRVRSTSSRRAPSSRAAESARSIASFACS